MADYEEVEREFAKEYPSRLYQQANSTRSNAFINKSRPMNALDNFVEAFSEPAEQRQETSKARKSIKEEMSLYSNQIRENSFSFSEFWNQYKIQYPNLHNKLIRTNIIPATSVPSESCFSISGYVQRKERSRLSPKHLRFLMLSKNSQQVENLLLKYETKNK